MRIQDYRKMDMKQFGIDTSCDVYKIHVIVDNVNECVQETIRIISDTSWVTRLDAIDQISFSAAFERTVDKLVNDIFSQVQNEITEAFGEYMVSVSAQSSLVESFDHIRIPLAELLKEKVSGNPGFDFHTESHTRYIAFGEAKFSMLKTPCTKALKQIVEFIDLGKDKIELRTLKSFVTKQAIEKATKNEKAYVAAFSLNSTKPDKIIIKALSSEFIKPLLEYPELYLIGVEVVA